jgi:hypothetical protein
VLNGELCHQGLKFCARFAMTRRELERLEFAGQEYQKGGSYGEKEVHSGMGYLCMPVCTGVG